MPHSPLENHTPLSNGGGQHQHQNQNYSTHSTSRSPVHAVNKNRNKSALNLGSILNPVASTLQAEQPADNVINQNGNDNNNSKPSSPTTTMNRTSVTGRYYKHSSTQHRPMKQEAISHNGVPIQPPVHMSFETINGTNSNFSDATKAPSIITNSSSNNNDDDNDGYTNGGDDNNNNEDNTQKQLPHRKRSKEKDTAIECSTMTNNNINNHIVDNTNIPGTLTSEATLKWQPVETPQGHYYSGDPQYNNGNNNGLPLTNGYHHHQQQQQRSSTTSTGLEMQNSISTPMHTSANEFVNTAMHGHHHHHPPSYHHSQSKQEPTSTPLYDTHNRRSDSTSMYTGSVSSPTIHSGNNLYYYYHQYPTPESPNNNKSSLNTSTFFNTEHDYQGDSRKRSSLPLDYNNNNNQQSKRVRQNSEVVTSAYSMQPPPQLSRSMDPQQSRIIQEQSNPYYSFPHQPAHHHHQQQQQRPIYYHSQHPHAQSFPPAPPPSFSPTSVDSDNSVTHYHYQHNQQQYPHPSPPLPPPTPPIKEKKKKKSKVSSEPGKPAKKGRPLKNPSSSSLTINPEQQPDAGSSINSKETSTIISDLSPTSSEITIQTPTLSPTLISTKPNPTSDEQQVTKKIPKKRGRPPKTEAQKAADAAARAAAAAAAAAANPSPPSEKKKAAKKSTKQVTSKKTQQQQKEVKRYCTCQSPLTTPQYMISCDHCGKWFHGFCIGISAKEGEFLDLYYCNECTAITGKKSTERLPCANTFTACQNPARASTKGSSRSKYCSEECGMRVARMRLERAQRAYESDHPNVATTPLERTLKGMLQAQQQNGKSKLNIDSNHWDISRLAEMKQERIKARAIVKFVDIQARFLSQVLESQEENDPKMCGYDSRLSWQNNVWHAIKNISREGTDIKVELSNQAEVEDVDVKEFTLCNKIGKCQKHEHWRELRQSELEVERKKQIDILSSLDRKRKQIKSRISDRLKQPEGWTFLDNGTICHD